MNSNNVDQILRELDQKNAALNEKLNDLLMPAIQGEKIFRWSENGLCDKTKIDRGLDESTTLSNTAIAKLEFVYSYIPDESPHFEPDKSIVLIPTAQIWGTRWRQVAFSPGIRPLGDRNIYKSAQGMICFFLTFQRAHD